MKVRILPHGLIPITDFLAFLLCFQDFLIANRVVSCKEEIPCRTLLSRINLNKIDHVCVKKTKEKLSAAASGPTVTCDTWCDKYKHRSYICFTMHFIDPDFSLQKYSLKTQPFEGSHTGEAIKDLFLKILNEFNINRNSVIVVSEMHSSSPKYVISSHFQVSDQGSNMCRAWNRLKIIHVYCIAHGIHNWLMKDCFPRLDDVSTIFDKIQCIINKLRYREAELEEDFQILQERPAKDVLARINETGELLDADSASSIEIDDFIGSIDDVDRQFQSVLNVK